MSDGLEPSADGRFRVWVKATDPTSVCAVSLASYLTQGPDFATSGRHVLTSFDTASVKDDSADTLDIATPEAGCFAQVDLYLGSVVYDGADSAGDEIEHGDLPQGPDKRLNATSIGTWNGGIFACKAPLAAPAAPVPTPSSGTPTPTTSRTAAPAPGPRAPFRGTIASPGATAQSLSSTPMPSFQSGSPSGSSSPLATPSGSSSARPAGTASAHPVDTPSTSVPMASSPPSHTGSLAHTGSGDLAAVSLGSAGLLLTGGSVVLVARRYRAGRHI